MALGFFVRPSVLVVILVTSSEILSLPVPAIVFSSAEGRSDPIDTSSNYYESKNEARRNIANHQYEAKDKSLLSPDIGSKITEEAMQISQESLDGIQGDLIVENNQKKRVKRILYKYGLQYSVLRRAKRSDPSQIPSSFIKNYTEAVLDYDIKFNGNKTVVCVDTSIIRLPTDRMSLRVSRWFIVGGATSIVTCALCIVFFYCRWRCFGRGQTNRERNFFAANPRATVFPSKPARGPQARNKRELLNNSRFNFPLPRDSDGGYHPNPRTGIMDSEYFQYLKTLEKNPDHLTRLMLDL